MTFEARSEGLRDRDGLCGPADVFSQAEFRFQNLLKVTIFIHLHLSWTSTTLIYASSMSSCQLEYKLVVKFWRLMFQDNPSQELLKKEKKASTSSSKSLLISPKALQESSSGVGGSFPSNKVNPSNSSIPQSDPSQKYQLHHVVGSLNTGSMV